jgi:hypothetical protein
MIFEKEKNEIIIDDLHLHTKSSIYETLSAPNFMVHNMIKKLQFTEEKEERRN